MINLGSSKEKNAPETRTTAPTDHTIIGPTVVITGELKCSGDIRIDGEFNGNLTTTGRLVLGEKGKIKGEVKCKEAEFSGYFNGKLDVVQALTLKSSSKVEGDVILSKLATDLGAIFNGSCKMRTDNPSIQNPTKE